jgi:UDP-galactopyranose mutase
MIVIVGAGPAGLSAGYHLGEAEYLILEQEAEPGGLCRSFDLDGCTFDLGGHAFFTRHSYVRELLGRLCEPGLFSQPREAWVHSHGRYLRYPFQTSLFGLPTEVVEECLVGFCDAVFLQRGAAPPANLREWIELTFGSGIGKHFLMPYNEKVWAYPLDEIAPEWTTNRVVTPDIRAIVAGALRSQQFSAYPNSTVTYPARGGFFNLYRGFTRTVGDRIRRAEVTEVLPRQRQLRTGHGDTVDYDAVISTMPLDVLVARTQGLAECCHSAAAQLRFNSLYLVNLVFDRPRLSDLQRVYSADPDIPFHKLVLNSNSSPELRDRPHFGIQAEVSWSAHKHVDPTDLVPRVLEALRRMEIVGPGDHLTASSVVPVERAYPVQTPATRAAREHLLETFRGYDILCAGRFGEWLYINSDDAVMRGKARADELTTPAPPIPV